MTQQKTNSRVLLLACAIIAIIIVGSIFFRFTMTEFTSGKSGFLAKIDLALANPELQYRELFGSTPIVGGNYSFSPPVSMYRAILIGLESDGWNAASLENMKVYVSLDYYIFYTNVTALYQVAAKENLTLEGRPNPNLNMTGTGFEQLHEVTEPAANYQPQFFSGVTIRYIWSISVEKDSGFGIPPPGYYMVDAATGELIPTGPLF
jgi:hypothetical protein